ncbi:hypothetical protein UY3_07182 [Chelonia mydas]|uniref:Uncharacterized protein n=1 Tax=Chelonia mydas TaxID=8469 RepID=M7BIZ6_CHEMY|nr:hypothetical protein UY3_07182 [Chelonia mydas]
MKTEMYNQFQANKPALSCADGTFIPSADSHFVDTAITDMFEMYQLTSENMATTNTASYMDKFKLKLELLRYLSCSSD